MTAESRSHSLLPFFVEELTFLVGVEELTCFPTDLYHEIVRSDLNCHESVGSERSQFVKSKIFVVLLCCQNNEFALKQFSPRSHGRNQLKFISDLNYQENREKISALHDRTLLSLFFIIYCCFYTEGSRICFHLVAVWDLQFAKKKENRS